MVDTEKHLSLPIRIGVLEWFNGKRCKKVSRSSVCWRFDRDYRLLSYLRETRQMSRQPSPWTGSRVRLPHPYSRVEMIPDTREQEEAYGHDPSARAVLHRAIPPAITCQGYYCRTSYSKLECLYLYEHGNSSVCIPSGNDGLPKIIPSRFN